MRQRRLTGFLLIGFFSSENYTKTFQIESVWTPVTYENGEIMVGDIQEENTKLIAKRTKYESRDTYT